MRLGGWLSDDNLCSAAVFGRARAVGRGLIATETEGDCGHCSLNSLCGIAMDTLNRGLLLETEGSHPLGRPPPTRPSVVLGRRMLPGLEAACSPFSDAAPASPAAGPTVAYIRMFIAAAVVLWNG